MIPIRIIGFLKSPKFLIYLKEIPEVSSKKTNGHSVLPPFWLSMTLPSKTTMAVNWGVPSPPAHKTRTRTSQAATKMSLSSTLTNLATAFLGATKTNHLQDVYTSYSKTHRINTSIDGGLDLQRWSLRPPWLQQAVPPLAFQNQHPFVTSNVISGCSTMVRKVRKIIYIYI